jgi:hypothetical protein
MTRSPPLLSSTGNEVITAAYCMIVHCGRQCAIAPAIHSKWQLIIPYVSDDELIFSIFAIELMRFLVVVARITFCLVAHRLHLY